MKVYVVHDDNEIYGVYEERADAEAEAEARNSVGHNYDAFVYVVGHLVVSSLEQRISLPISSEERMQ